MKLQWKIARPSITLVAGAVFLLSLGFFLLTGVTSTRHLADLVVAAYLVVWAAYGFISKAPRREVAKEFLLTTTTLVGLVLLVEVPALVGLVDYREVLSPVRRHFGSWSPWNLPGYRADQELLWTRLPYHRLSGLYRRGNIGEALCSPIEQQYNLDVKYDGNGFRNETDLLTAEIAVVGDSYVESPMMPTRALMTSVLSELHGGAVANLGISGYGPQQELAVLRRYALPLSPKTIVWVFFEGNDLKEADSYDRRRHALLESALPSTRVLDRSFTKNALSALVRPAQPCTPHPVVAKNYGTLQNQEGRSASIYFLEPSVPLSPNDIDALKKTSSALAEAYRLCRERGVRFVVVFAPTTFRVHQGLANLVEVSNEVKRWNVTDVPDRLREIVAGISADIDYVDLTPFLRAEAEKGTPVFLPDDSHWTPAGHQIAANALHTLSTGEPSLGVKHNGGERVEDRLLMVRSPDGTIRYWDKKATQMYGWESNEALGKSSHRLLKTVFPKPLPAIEAELLEKGQWEGELVHSRRNGSQVVVATRWELQRDPKGRFATVVEINSHEVVKQPKWQLKEDVALMVRGPDGTIRYWNEASEEMYGWLAGEALGKSSHRLLKTVFPKPLVAIEAELLEKGQWEGELVHQRRDGSRLRVFTRWELQSHGTDQPPTVIETNNTRQRVARQSPSSFLHG